MYLNCFKISKDIQFLTVFIIICQPFYDVPSSLFQNFKFMLLLAAFLSLLIKPLSTIASHFNSANPDTHPPPGARLAHAHTHTHRFMHPIFRSSYLLICTTAPFIPAPYRSPKAQAPRHPARPSHPSEPLASNEPAQFTRPVKKPNPSSITRFMPPFHLTLTTPSQLRFLPDSKF